MGEGGRGPGASHGGTLGMSLLSVAFVRASILYLFTGILLGLIMAFPSGYAWLSGLALGNPSFAHAHVPGFMLIMVSGVAYHIFPLFTGQSSPGSHLPGQRTGLPGPPRSTRPGWRSCPRASGASP